MNIVIYLILFLLPLIFVPSLNMSFELPKMAFFRAMTMIMLFIFVLVLLKNKKISLPDIFNNVLARMAIGLFLLLLIFNVVISIAPSLSVWGSYFRMQGIYSYMHYFLFFILTAALLIKNSDWEKALKFLFGGFVLVSIYGIVQKFGFDLAGYNLQEVSLGRVFSSLGHPNYFANFIILTIFPLIALGMNLKRKWIVRTVLLLGLFGLILTESRGAFLGLIAGGTCFILFNAIFLKKKKLLIGAILIPVFLGAVFFFGNSRSLQVRLNIWESTLPMIEERIFTGYGMDTFALSYSPYANKENLKYELIESAPDKAHNSILEILAETGIAGLFVFLFCIYAIIKFSFSRLWKISKEKKIFVISILSAFAGIFISNFFGFLDTTNLVITAFFLAFLMFLLSENFIEKKFDFLKRKFFGNFLIVLTTIFVAGSILFENVFPVLADYYFMKKNLALATSLNQNQSYYNYVLSRVFLQNDEKEEAIKYAKEGGKFNGYMDAQYFLLEGEILGKEESFEKAYELAPVYPNLLLHWGEFYLKNSQCDKANEKFKEYLTIVPDYYKYPGTENYRLFYKHNPAFDRVFEDIKACK